MKRTISRFNVYQLVADLDIINKEIIEALANEKRAHDDIFDICLLGKTNSKDPWDKWETEKSNSYKPSRIQHYHKMSRIRMKLEKQRRIILMRLAKFDYESNNIINLV